MHKIRHILIVLLAIITLSLSSLPTMSAGGSGGSGDGSGGGGSGSGGGGSGSGGGGGDGGGSGGGRDDKNRITGTRVGGSISDWAIPEFVVGVDAIEAENWDTAIHQLTLVVQKSASNDDAENWLAYAYRKSGNLEMAFVHYRLALRYNPDHLGAHEYIGEAYLDVGNLAKAEEHLNILKNLCAGECEQYIDLKEEVAEFRGETSKQEVAGNKPTETPPD